MAVQTTVSRFVNDLDRAVQQASGSQALTLLKGQCANMEEYKRKVGFSEGMTACVDLARQMLRQMEINEEDKGLPEMPQKKAGGRKR